MKLFNIFCMFIYSNGMDNYRDARIELPPPPPSPVSTEKIYMLPSPSPVSTEKISYNYFLL